MPDDKDINKIVEKDMLGEVYQAPLTIDVEASIQEVRSLMEAQEWNRVILIVNIHLHQQIRRHYGIDQNKPDFSIANMRVVVTLDNTHNYFEIIPILYGEDNFLVYTPIELVKPIIDGFDDTTNKGVRNG